MAPKTFAAVLALCASALASPYPSASTPAAFLTGTAIDGALDPNAVRPTAAAVHGPLAAAVSAGPEYLTLQVTNQAGFDISTSHARNADAPTPIGGPIGTGTIANGAAATMVVPTAYAGNIAIVEYGGGREITGDDSLIEFNYVVSDGYSYAVADVDISYVNGFSVPIICKCSGVQVTGCNLSLWGLNTCPDDDGVGACVNPLRADNYATSATTFFAPCAGKAYTFPNDSAANSWGACQNGVISCCVGATCS